MPRDIIGHSEILSAFDRLVAAGRLAHAYLLVGPPGVGKMTVTEWLAARLLCTAAHRRPCGACDACGAVERGTHPDVLRLSGEDVRSVDRVREWTSSLSRSSLFAGWKIGIVEGAERMNEAGANACLKAIEEPTPRTVILLTAPTRRAVLPTIASRCAVVACNRVPHTALVAALRDRGVANAEATATLAEGCPGRAITLAEDRERRTAYEERCTIANALLSGTVVERLRRAESFMRSLPSERNAAVAEVMELVREFRAIARAFTGTQRARADWVRWQQLLAAAPRYLSANVAPRLLLETIILTHPRI